ncbi:MAG: hypothetical protein ACFFG0_06885 [Candidatus Thorarchaeota archaeon]
MSGILITPFNNYEFIPDKGQIEFLSFEGGGFFGIKSNDGKYYDPINLPDEYKIDGLHVIFLAKGLKNQTTYHLWARVVELVIIKMAK